MNKQYKPPHNKKYIIQLSDQERIQLQHIITKGEHNARVYKRTMILLESDEGIKDEDIAAHARTAKRTVERVRKRYIEGGIERALHDAPRPGQPPKLVDKKEAHLVAIACSSPPEGRTRWTLELLQEKLLKDGAVERISTVAIWNHLNDRGIKPWREKNVVHPKDHR